MASIFNNNFNDLRELLYGKSASAFDESINNVTSEILNTQRMHTTTIVELLQKSLQIEDSKRSGKEVEKKTPEEIVKKTHSIIKQALKRKTVKLPTGRAALYNKIDEVYNYNPEVAQAINIYVDNVLSPDIFTKNSIDIISKIKSINKDGTIFDQLRTLYYNIKTHFDLEKKITSITSDFLKYGDNFIEIRNPKEELRMYDVLKENYTAIGEGQLEVLMESSLQTKSKTNEETEGLETFDFIVPKVLMEAEEKKDNLEKKEVKVEKEINNLKAETKDKINKKFNKLDKEKAKKKYTIKDLSIKMHSPKAVIGLFSDDFVIGYLVIENVKNNVLGRNNTSLGSAEIPGQDISKTIIEKILKNIKDLLKIKNIQDDSEALLMIQHLLTLQKQKQGKVTTRFVPPDKMVHFKLEPSQFGDYGESVLQPILFTGSLLTALRLALVIYRLARAPEKRVFNIETGLTKDAADLIEQVKSEFDRREVTVDKLGTVDSISSIVSSFESIYLPMNNGKKFVEMDVVSGGQLADKVEDANFILKELLSGLGIPPALLGFERQEEAKSSLSQQNIMFARTIVGQQKQLSHYLTELFLKVVKITHPGLYVSAKTLMSVVLKPPRALMLESLSAMADEVDKLVGVFEHLNLPTENFVQFYLGDVVDPEWLKMYQFKEKLDKEMSTKSEGSSGGTENLGGL